VLRLTTLSSSCAFRLKELDPQASGTLFCFNSVVPRTSMDSLSLPEFESQLFERPLPSLVTTSYTLFQLLFSGHLFMVSLLWKRFYNNENQLKFPDD
jgi:hypothetical protein